MRLGLLLTIANTLEQTVAPVAEGLNAAEKQKKPDIKSGFSSCFG